jgi:2-polyprenyl-3-methyl-5-hydroxy-6-metoxy-1,4-benzoquinol methylase
MKRSNCIFCDIPNNHIVIQENGYDGIQCSQCNLIYIFPKPPFAEIVNIYSHDRAHLSAASHISASFAKRLYAKHTIALIQKFIIKGAMLEIGAGAGYFLDEARNKSFDVYGIELNTIQADFTRKTLKIPCEESTLDVSLFGGKKFDIVYLCDVISHLYDPISAFYTINDMLNRHGFVVFETGNLGDVKKEYYKHFSRFQYPDHLFFFSENNLKKLLRKNGFELVAIYRYSILLQLMLTKKINSILRLLQPNIKDGKDKPFIKKAYNYGFNITSNFLTDYFSYFMRYKIGYIVSKKGRPQTVIIIARKIN